MATKLLASAVESAEIIDVSERKFHDLRKNPDFPKPVTLGPRCLRWRVEDLQAWVGALPDAETQAVPERLLDGKKAKRASRAASK